MGKIIAKLYKRQDGLSLVELVIVLALLGIVLALGYMYLDFGAQAFDRGEEKTIAQKALRFTSNFLTSELRFAKEVEINPGEGFEEGYRYVYLENDNIIFRDEEGSERLLADAGADEMPFSIYFTCSVPDDVVIMYLIADYSIDIHADGFDIEQLYEEEKGLYFLKTRVQALNLELFRTYGLDEPMIQLNEDGGTKIKYKLPEGD